MQTYQTELREEWMEYINKTEAQAVYDYDYERIADWWIAKLRAREEWLRGQKNVYFYKDNELWMSVEENVDTVNITRNGEVYKLSLTPKN